MTIESPATTMPAEEQHPTDHDKRRALPWLVASQALNAIFFLWTFGGSVFLLFLSELGLPKWQMGIMLSLFPFCGLLALGFAPVATRWGRKRAFLLCYGARKFVMAGLLLLPWLLAHGSRTGAILFLFAIISIFAVLRALAETACYPWSQEFVPNSIRGRLGAISMVVVTLVSCLALFVAGHVIGQGTGLNRFMLLIGAGCVVGVVSVALMGRVPGGAPDREGAASDTHLANMIQSLRDRNFAAYLGGMGCFTIGSVLLVSFLPLYAKEQMGLTAGAVVRLDAAMMIGAVAFSLLIGWAADRVGSHPVLMPSLALCLLLPVAWLMLPRQTPHAALWCAALYLVYGAASCGVAISAGRLLFNGVVPPERNTSYTAVYYAWMGVTGGIAPLLAGGILAACAGWARSVGPWVADGYVVMFAAAAVLIAFGWLLCGRVRPDQVHTTRTVFRQLAAMLPWRPFFGSTG